MITFLVIAGVVIIFMGMLSVPAFEWGGGFLVALLGVAMLLTGLVMFDSGRLSQCESKGGVYFHKEGVCIDAKAIGAIKLK